jgi:hypothetical protein
MTTTVGSYPFTVQVSDAQSPPATAAAQLSITVNATLTQLSIVTTSLPSGTQNQTYSAMLAATGGLTPYTWNITAGSLPAGLSLNSSTGAITGAPTGGGTSTFTVQVTDANTPPATASAQLSITITPAVLLRITTTSLPSGVFGTAYSAMLTATGGVYPYTWTITAGSLPAGLSLNGSTGAITGTPTGGGPSIFTIQVADSESPSQTATAQLSISIANGIFITAITPNSFFCLPTTFCLFGPFMVFKVDPVGAGYIAKLSGYQPQTLGSGDPGYPTQFEAILNNDFRPRFINVEVDSPDGTVKSNIKPFANLGDQPIAAAASDFMFALNQGAGTINKYNRSNGAFVTSFSANGREGIAVDRASDGTAKYVVTENDQGFSWSDPNGNRIGAGHGDGATLAGVTANQDDTCGPEPSAGKDVCVPMGTGAQTAQLFAAGTRPQAVALTSCAGENDLLTFDAEGLQLFKHFIAPDGTGTLRGSVPLSDAFTAASNFDTGTLTYGLDWYVAVLPSCKAAVVAPFKNVDGTVSLKVTIVDANTMTETIPGGVSLPANTFRVYADEVNGNFIVASSDASGSQGVNHFAKVDPSGTLTPLSSTSPILAVGGGVSLDGNSLYVTGWDPLDDGAGLQVKFVPNN